MTTEFLFLENYPTHYITNAKMCHIIQISRYFVFSVYSLAC